MHQSGKNAFSLMPLVVIGCIVLGSMLVNLALYVFSGLTAFPVSLVFLALAAGFVVLAVSSFAASLSRRGNRKGEK